MPATSARLAQAGTESTKNGGRGGGGAGAMSLRHRHDELDIDPKSLCIHAMHRKLEAIDDYFLHPWKPTLFGLPILVYGIPGKTTYANLYEMIWEKTRRYTAAPPSVDMRHMFASMATDAKGRLSLSRERSESRNMGHDDGEPADVNVLPPFALKRVNRNGTQCSQCSWLKLCMGTLVLPFVTPHDFFLAPVRSFS